MSSAPYFYQQIDAYNSMFSPNTVHVKNTGLGLYFRKYLVQKAFSPFKFTLPETWESNYFLYVLYLCGFVAVVNTNKFGVICQKATLGGYNVYYQPTFALITNPLLSGNTRPQINKDCTVIRLQPDYSGVGDIVGLYADLMALTVEGGAVNILNSKLAYILFAKNKAAAESLKKVTDNVLSGEPAVAINQSLFDSQGQPLLDTFTQDLRSNFIAPEQMDLLVKLEQMFCAQIGLPNANTNKKERMIVDEVAANDFSTRSMCEVWFDQLAEGFEKTRKMFGYTKEQLSVEWREGVKPDGDVYNRDGRVQSLSETV